MTITPERQILIFKVKYNPQFNFKMKEKTAKEVVRFCGAGVTGVWEPVGYWELELRSSARVHVFEQLSCFPHIVVILNSTSLGIFLGYNVIA